MTTITIQQSVAQCAADAAALFAWEKDQAAATKMSRQDMTLELFASMRHLSEQGMDDGAIVNASYALGVEMANRGLKASGIKVRRSEFRRIWENIHLVDPDCSSWKKALASIAESQATAEDKRLALVDAIAKAQERLDDLTAQLAEMDVEFEIVEDVEMLKDGTNG